MIMGALGGALTMRYLPSEQLSLRDDPGGACWLPPLVGMVYSCLLAVACINFKADQTVGRHGAEPAGHRRGHRHRQGHQHCGQPR